MYGKFNNGHQDMWGWTVVSHVMDGVRVNHYR